MSFEVFVLLRLRIPFFWVMNSSDRIIGPRYSKQENVLVFEVCNSIYLYISTLEGEDNSLSRNVWNWLLRDATSHPIRSGCLPCAPLFETTTVVIHETVKRHNPVSKTPPCRAVTALAPGQSLHTLKVHSLDLDTRSDCMQASFCPSPQLPRSQ